MATVREEIANLLRGRGGILSRITSGQGILATILADLTGLIGTGGGGNPFGCDSACTQALNNLSTQYQQCVQTMLNQESAYVKANPAGFDQSENDYIKSASSLCQSILNQIVQVAKENSIDWQTILEDIVIGVFAVIFIKVFGSAIWNGIQSSFRTRALSAFSGGMYATDALVNAMFWVGEIDTAVFSAYASTLSDLAFNTTYGLWTAESSLLESTYVADADLSLAEAQQLAAAQQAAMTSDIGFLESIPPPPLV